MTADPTNTASSLNGTTTTTANNTATSTTNETPKPQNPMVQYLIVKIISCYVIVIYNL